MSKRRKISQAEARRLKKKCDGLQSIIDEQRASWRDDYPGGTHIGTVSVEVREYSALHTARRLGHAVVCVETGNSRLELYALPLPGGAR